MSTSDIRPRRQTSEDDARAERRLSCALVLVALALAPAVAAAQGSTDPFLGVRMDESSGNVRVSSVLPGSGAARGGLVPGDQLVSVRGVAVSTAGEVTGALRSARVGERIPVVLLRGGGSRTLTVELGPRPARGAALQAFVGEQAPPVRLAEIGGGGAVDLAGLRGRVAIVYFWSIWCGACRTAMPTLDRWQRSLGSRGLTIIGVTDDPPEEVRRALARSPLAYSVGHDAGAKVGSAYWIEALPTFFVVDRAGRVVRVVEGWDPSQSGSLEAEILRLIASSAP